jgi:hypothetical protein
MKFFLDTGNVKEIRDTGAGCVAASSHARG